MKKFKKYSEILLATSNEGKQREYRHLLNNLDVKILSFFDRNLNYCSPDETGKTFTQNAFIKAKSAADFFHLPSIAEDSGLCVNSLDGDPGIYSARYGGGKLSDEEKCTYLLENLDGFKDRSAYFNCSICYYDPAIKKEIYFEGRVYGEILKTPDGKNGFGYDPIFFHPPLNLSFATMPAEEKNKISHRAIAVGKLQTFLANLSEK